MWDDDAHAFYERSLGEILTGADQLTYEVYPEKGTVFPAHRILIADNGIYIVEKDGKKV